MVLKRSVIFVRPEGEICQKIIIRCQFKKKEVWNEVRSLIIVVFYHCGLSSRWSFIWVILVSMVFCMGGLSSGWSFISGLPSEEVVFKPDGVSSVVFCQGKRSFLNRMVFHQWSSIKESSLSTGWSFISGRSSGNGLSTGWSFISGLPTWKVVCQQDTLFSVVFHQGKWSFNRMVFYEGGLSSKVPM